MTGPGVNKRIVLFRLKRLTLHPPVWKAYKGEKEGGVVIP